MASRRATSTGNKKNVVRVHEERKWEEEISDDVDENGEGEIETPETLGPLQVFFKELDAAKVYTMYVWALPNYKLTGHTGRRADSIYVKCFPFSGDDIDTYREVIQQLYPAGGMFYIEVRNQGAVVKSWNEQIAGIPTYQSPQGLHPSVINIHQPQPGQAQSVIGSAPDPFEVIERQANSFLKVAEVIKKLQPEHPTIVADSNSNGQRQQDNRPLLERLVEPLALKILEKDDDGSKTEKVIDILAGRENKTPGFFESMGPLFAKMFETLLPIIGWEINTFMARRRAGEAAVPRGAAASPAHAGAVIEQSALPAGSVTEPPQPTDPREAAWRRVIRRIIEDCADQNSVGAAVNSICDLYARVPDLRPTVEQLVTMQPAQVIALCAMTASTSQEEAQWISNLASYGGALEWVITLQTETKAALEELRQSQEEEANVPAPAEKAKPPKKGKRNG